MIGDKNMELKSNIAGMVNVETVNGEIDINVEEKNFFIKSIK